MPTDTERREVARRLRSVNMDDFSCYSEEFEGLYKAIGLYDGEEYSEQDWPERLADLIEPDDPPYNLYTLYEAVFHRSPRCWECIEDDEVDELVDALLDICNALGHEHIRRSEPAYPDATASYRGWRAEVYDPDGVLASPSNVAADLVRAHADGKGPGIDREALLALADRMEHMAGMGALLEAHGLAMAAASIREALGVES